VENSKKCKNRSRVIHIHNNFNLNIRLFPPIINHHTLKWNYNLWKTTTELWFRNQSTPSMVEHSIMLCGIMDYIFHTHPFLCKSGLYAAGLHWSL